MHWKYVWKLYMYKNVFWHIVLLFTDDVTKMFCFPSFLLFSLRKSLLSNQIITYLICNEYENAH